MCRNHYGQQWHLLQLCAIPHWYLPTLVGHVVQLHAERHPLLVSSAADLPAMDVVVDGLSTSSVELVMFSSTHALLHDHKCQNTRGLHTCTSILFDCLHVLLHAHHHWYTQHAGLFLSKRPANCKLHFAAVFSVHVANCVHSACTVQHSHHLLLQGVCAFATTFTSVLYLINITDMSSVLQHSFDPQPWQSRA